MAAPNYEERACWCWRGQVYESAVPTGHWVLCDRCDGTGVVRAFVYARPNKKRA